MARFAEHKFTPSGIPKQTYDVFDQLLKKEKKTVNIFKKDLENNLFKRWDFTLTNDILPFVNNNQREFKMQHNTPICKFCAE